MEIKSILPSIAALFIFIGAASSASGSLENALKTYDTLHHSQFTHRILKRDVETNHPNIRQVKFDSLGRHFHLYLQQKETVLANDFKIIAIDENNHKRQIDLEPHTYEGYVIGEDDSSEVQAVWDDDENLSATITTNDEVYVVEPSWRHLPDSSNYSMIVYRRSDVKMLDDLGKSFCGSIDPNKDPDYKQYHNIQKNEEEEDEDKNEKLKWKKDANHNEARIKRQAEEGFAQPGKTAAFTSVPYRTTCQVKLVADYKFFQEMGKSSLSKTSSYLIGLLDRVDAIYRRTDFGKGFIGMGFEIKEIHIHEGPTRSTKYAHYNEERTKPWDTKALLEAFSRDNTYKFFCLAHLFTYQAFDGGVLGLAYIGSPRTYSVGGICSPGVTQSEAIAMGIYIDTDYYKGGARLYLNTGWSSALNRYNRRLLTQEADLVTTHEFGHNWGSEHDPDTPECSPSAFSGGKYIMYTYSVSGFDVNNRVFSPCSRRSIGAVLEAKAHSCFEAKRMFFCGNSRVERPTEQCDVGPEVTKGSDKCCDEKCQLRAGVVCSDRNDLCCENCQYAPSDRQCHEELVDSGSCEGVAYCTGNNATCPPPSKKPDGTACSGRGQCKDGKCMPLCETVGRVSCICDELDTSCKWCCKSDHHNSTCEPYIENPNTNSSIDLPNGMPCVQGSCENGVCNKQVQDLVQRIWQIIENLTPDQFVEFMRANIVGTVIILSLIIWIPVSCIVSWKDRQMRNEEKMQTDWRADDNKLQHPDDMTKIRYGGTRSRGEYQQKGRYQHLQAHPDYHQGPSQPYPLATNI